MNHDWHTLDELAGLEVRETDLGFDVRHRDSQQITSLTPQEFELWRSGLLDLDIEAPDNGS